MSNGRPVWRGERYSIDGNGMVYNGSRTPPEPSAAVHVMQGRYVIVRS